VVTWFGVAERRAAAQAMYFDHGDTRKVVNGESSGLTAWSSRARSERESVIVGRYHSGVGSRPGDDGVDRPQGVGIGEGPEVAD
jgi:hypothetical protein